MGKTLTTKEVMLYRKAMEQLSNAYCPYSKYQVAAAVMDRNRNVWLGNNIENASYGLTICAERAAIFNMVTSCVDYQVTDIMIITKDGSMPCGACRQVMQEFASKDIGLNVYIGDLTGVESIRHYDLEDLLPNPFSLTD